MGMNRYEKQLMYQKSTSVTTGSGHPSNAEGSDGSITIRDINGQITLFAKYGGTWFGRDLGPTLVVGDTHLNHVTVGSDGIHIKDGDTYIASFQEDITLTSGTINFHDGTRNRLVIGANDIDMYDEAGTNVLNIDTGVVTLLSSSSDKLTLSSAGIVFHAGGADVMSLDSGNINMTGKINITSAGTRNVCIGAWASTNPDQGTDNIAIGSEAGSALGSNSVNNIMIGTNAGFACTGAGGSSDNNVIIGAEAGKSDTTPDQCVIIGHEASEHLDTSRFNIAIGYKALRGTNSSDSSSNATSALYNVAIGVSAMGSCHAVVDAGGDDPQGNVAVGHESMRNVSGDDNISIGVQAGDTITTGSDNICIGNSAEPSAATGTNQIALGEDVVCTGNNRITIGHGFDTATLDLDGSDTGWAAASSDERFKENISTSTAGLSFINDLRPVTYNWKKKKDVPSDTIYYEESSDDACLGYTYGTKLHGFIAQEVKTVIDNHSEIGDGFKMWKQYDNGIQTVADGNLIPILTKAVQELSAKIDTMQTEINNLKG